jgi:hypothetical protein
LRDSSNEQDRDDCEDLRNELANVQACDETDVDAGTQERGRRVRRPAAERPGRRLSDEEVRSTLPPTPVIVPSRIEAGIGRPALRPPWAPITLNRASEIASINSIPSRIRLAACAKKAPRIAARAIAHRYHGSCSARGTRARRTSRICLRPIR